jgi:hypothetical protein
MIHEPSGDRIRTKRKLPSLAFQRINECLISMLYEGDVADSVQGGLLNPNAESKLMTTCNLAKGMARAYSPW